MLGGGLQLALIPAPLIVAAIIVFGLSPAHARVARIVAGLGGLGSIALLALEMAFLGGGRIEASLGTPVAGIDYLLRLDLPGAILGLAAATVGVLVLLDADRQTREVRAVLVCVIGTIVAALAGNLVVLTGGVEIAAVGTLLMTSAARGHPGRGGLMSIALVHLASLGLLVAAVQLLSSSGTTDFAVIPAGAVGASVAGPWAAAGVTRLLATAFVPVRGNRTPTAAWAATGTIPCGAIVILRLREVVDGPLPQGIAIGLAVLGGGAAVWAAALALRWSGVPAVAGRALCVIVAAPVVALSGIAGATADAAVAAGICALMLVAALTPAWERIGRGRPGTLLAALALSVAGSLPLGFGISALILELAATVSIGRAGTALLAALGVASLLGAAAAVRTAAAVLTAGQSTGVARPRLSELAVVAAVISLAGAILPGAAATTILATLSPGGLIEPIGGVAIRSAAGDWSGGYLVVAFLVVAAGVWAFATLAERPLVTSPSPQQASVPADVQALGLGPARRLRPALIHGFGWLRQLDTWLVVQPQLALMLVGAILAILLIHS
jgi:formate hydrogenlyase subunit 3/multisubunit Na+/H+ antiporter MnhD subunit